MEFFDGDTTTRIEAIRRLRRMKYERRGRVALLNVGQTKDYIYDQAQRAVDFIYDPLPENGLHPADPSHVYLSNIPEIDTPEGEAIGDLMVHRIIESWPAIPD
jgi:hypothetical protein